jgi:DDB1- and CUL4-associated factor 5
MADSGDEYFATGSDDFQAYVWRIPSNAKLSQGGALVSQEDWSMKDPGIVGMRLRSLCLVDLKKLPIAYVQRSFGERYIPEELHSPHTRLTGL